MESLNTLDGIGLIASALVVVVYFALRRIASRMGDDLYALVKGFLLWLFGRRRPAPPPASSPPPAAPTTASPVTAMPAPPTPEPAPETPLLSTGLGDYFAPRFLAAGELAKLYQADFHPRTSGEPYPVVLKVAREAAATPALQQEVRVLHALHRDPGSQAKHLPQVVEAFRTEEGHAGTVFKALDGWTLTKLRARFPTGIEARHVLWMFRRSLSILGYAHSRGILHGHLHPDHVLIRPRDHNVWLLDWTRAIERPAETRQGFAATDPVYAPPEAHRRQAPVPASDLYALGKVMIFAFGGDPVTAALPETVPEALARFTRALLKDSPLQRPRDAWELYQALEKIRDTLYGPHRFVEFIVDETAP